MKKISAVIVAAAMALGLSSCYLPAVDESPQPNERAAQKPSASADVNSSPTQKKSQVEELRDCINKTGTASEKAVAKHITKVSGAANGEARGIAEIFTDYSGDLVSGAGSKGKLIASAFSSCYKSEDGNSGWVTVYNKDGELLSDGNY